MTETALVADTSLAAASLKALKAMGIHVALDDFGTGYSSLGTLCQLPFDKVKIDASFIGTMERDESARTIVETILGMARNLGIKVIAEGVETVTQREFLALRGCDMLQGYLLGGPVPAACLGAHWGAHWAAGREEAMPAAA